MMLGFALWGGLASLYLTRAVTGSGFVTVIDVLTTTPSECDVFGGGCGRGSAGAHGPSCGEAARRSVQHRVPALDGMGDDVRRCRNVLAGGVGVLAPPLDLMTGFALDRLHRVVTMRGPRSSSRYSQPSAAGLSGDDRALTAPAAAKALNCARNWVNSSRPSRGRLVQSANRSGSVSPAMSAAKIARPLTPRMSVTTRSALRSRLRASSAGVACAARSRGPVACGFASGRAVPGSGPAARSCPESSRAPTDPRSRPRRSGRSCGPERSGCAARWRTTGELRTCSHQVLPVLDEVAKTELLDLLPVDPGLVAEVEAVESLDKREAGQVRSHRDVPGGLR